MPRKKKRPEEPEFIAWAEHVWRWAVPRWRYLLLVIVVIAAGFAVNEYNKRRSSKAELEYAEIMEIKDDDARLLRLEEFANKHREKDLASQALMLLGSYNYGRGDKDKAAEFYKKVIDSTGNDLIETAAINAVAPIYVDMKRFNDAADLYLRIAMPGSSPWPYLAKYNAGYVYEQAGDMAKAREIYKGLSEDEKTPPDVKFKAEEKLLWIAATRDASRQK